MSARSRPITLFRSRVNPRSEVYRADVRRRQRGVMAKSVNNSAERESMKVLSSSGVKSVATKCPYLQSSEP